MKPPLLGNLDLNSARRGIWEPGLWHRFDRYEILEHKNGPYIIPAEGSRYLGYFLTNEPDLLQDFLILGKWYYDECAANEKTGEPLSMPRLAHRVLLFCKKYGLLGLAWEQGEKTFGYDTWWKGPKWNKLMSSYTPKGRPIEAHSMDYEVQVRDYAEPAQEIASEACGMFSLALMWNSFCELNPSPQDTITVEDRGRRFDVTYDTFLYLTMVRGISVTFNPFAKGAGVTFISTSLIQNIRILFLLAISARDKQLRLCSECAIPFTAIDPRAKFCSNRCSARSRQRRFQENKKASAQKTAALSTAKTVVKTVGELSTKQGKTGEKPRKRKTR